MEAKSLYRAPALRSLPGADAILRTGEGCCPGGRRPCVDFLRLWCTSALRLPISSLKMELKLGQMTLQPLDDDAIIAAARECGKVVIVHEDTRTGGLAGELTAESLRRLLSGRTGSSVTAKHAGALQ